MQVSGFKAHIQSINIGLKSTVLLAIFNNMILDGAS